MKAQTLVVECDLALLYWHIPPLFALYCHRIAFSEVGDLAYVVYQAVEHPLNVHLLLASQGESIHSLLSPDVAEDRFNDAEPFAVGLAALRRIDLLLHRIGQTAGPAAMKDAYLS